MNPITKVVAYWKLLRAGIRLVGDPSRLNEVFADWVCAKPVWGDVARYRKHHLAHHAHTGTALDPDRCLADPFPVTRASLARKLLRDAVGITGLKRVLTRIAARLSGQEMRLFDTRAEAVAWLLCREVGGGAIVFEPWSA